MPIEWLSLCINITDIIIKCLVAILSGYPLQIHQHPGTQNWSAIRRFLRAKIKWLIEPWHLLSFSWMIVIMVKYSIHTNIKRMNRFLDEQTVIFIIDVGHINLILIRTTLTESFDSQNMNTSFIRLRLRNMIKHVYLMCWN